MRSWLTLVVALIAAAGCAGPAVIPDPCPASFPRLPVASDLVADAGPDFEARPGDHVQFDGAASTSTDGKPFTYSWGQVLGPCAALDLKDPARPVVVVPHVHPGDETLVFRLTLLRDGAMSTSDDMEILVRA